MPSSPRFVYTTAPLLTSMSAEISLSSPAAPLPILEGSRLSPELFRYTPPVPLPAETRSPDTADDVLGNRLVDLLEHAERQGRFCLPQGDLLRQARADPGVTPGQLEDALERLVAGGVLFRSQTDRGAVLFRDPSNPERAVRGLVHLISKAEREGHAALPLSTVMTSTRKLLRCEEPTVIKGLDTLVAEGTLVVEPVGSEALVYAAAAQRAEVAMVKRLMELRRPSGIRPPRNRRLRKILARAARASGMALNQGQSEAVATLLRHPVTLITGAPGTGKTTVIRTAVDALARVSRGRPILLAAPTGKAALRLAKATGRGAQTIHRLLKYSTEAGGFLHDRHNPLDAAAVIVDEASMIGLELMTDLLAAIPRDCRLVLVGDPDQLPPVACGQPFADMLASGHFPIARLAAVLRQSEGSAIAAACKAIRQGRMPHLPRYPRNTELSHLPIPANDILTPVQQAVTDLIQTGLDPLADLQVLTPTKDKAGGVHALNAALAPICNPITDTEMPTCRLMGGIGRIGDKVQQMRNNYEKAIANGDQGRLLRIDRGPFGRARIVALFGTLEVTYTAREAAAELALAYAITIHRSQGSEWPAVVLCLPATARRMLSRNLLYTALSRGKRRVIVIGGRDGIAEAVRSPGTRRIGGVIERLHLQAANSNFAPALTLAHRFG